MDASPASVFRLDAFPSVELLQSRNHSSVKSNDDSTVHLPKRTQAFRKLVCNPSPSAAFPAYDLHSCIMLQARLPGSHRMQGPHTGQL